MAPTRAPSTMNVIVKHSGKAYPVTLDVSAPATTFKDAIYRATGVPTERMKVMLKGILKDDADMSKLGIKEGQAITVVGAAGPLPEAPAEPIVFLEDMDDSELAVATRVPPGLINLGNTCYLNSTLQALRTVPQLQEALSSSVPKQGLEGKLTTSIKNLYGGMQQTTEAVPPLALLQNLRTLAPQFAETDQRGQYAQQAAEDSTNAVLLDADEAWTQLISALRASIPGQNGQGSFVDDWMSIELSKTLSSPEASSEESTVSTETALKLECNISITTNFLMSGILDSLNQDVEKNSPSLGRTAVYHSKSRLSRLPAYLAIHMVRFYWRRDIQKKAKIMRKVKFPLQLDVLDIATDELRNQLQPVNNTVKQILKTRDDRAKIAKRRKGKGATSDDKSEEQWRDEEHKEVVAALETAGVAPVTGTNTSGMYELCAMVTHKGASADSGHYIGWARKDDADFAASGEEEWYKFDDDKVSVVTADKIQSMDGGGEDSVAYILLYRAINV